MIFCCVGLGKEQGVTISLSPQGGAYTRALKSEKSLSLPIPVGGGAVDTNDWCIKGHLRLSFIGEYVILQLYMLLTYLLRVFPDAQNPAF